jgi:hypothetical protein
MLMIFCVLFLGFAIYGLFKGKINYGSTIKFLEERAKVNDAKDMDKKIVSDAMFKICLSFVFFGIVQLVVLAYCYDYDRFKLPTIAMTLVLVLFFCSALFKESYFDDQEKIKEKLKTLKRKTLKDFSFDFASTAYYFYILWVMVCE